VDFFWVNHLLSMEKHCPRCLETKPVADFHKDKSRKDGLFCYCKACNVRHVKAWQQQNNERVNAGHRKNYAKNLEASREARRVRVRRWYAKHAESQKLRAAEYRKAKPEIKRLSQSKRRALQRGNGVFVVTQRDVMRLLRAPCAACGSLTNQTIDHVIPIALGGRHSIGNLQTLCFSCNSSKHTKIMSQWKRERKVYEPLRQG
jgi:5-methylcytosine-specific restriction endonuclease McrA